MHGPLSLHPTRANYLGHDTLLLFRVVRLVIIRKVFSGQLRGIGGVD